MAEHVILKMRQLLESSDLEKTLQRAFVSGQLTFDQYVNRLISSLGAGHMGTKKALARRAEFLVMRPEDGPDATQQKQAQIGELHMQARRAGAMLMLKEIERHGRVDNYIIEHLRADYFRGPRIIPIATPAGVSLRIGPTEAINPRFRLRYEPKRPISNDVIEVRPVILFVPTIGALDELLSGHRMGYDRMVDKVLHQGQWRGGGGRWMGPHGV